MIDLIDLPRTAWQVLPPPAGQVWLTVILILFSALAWGLSKNLVKKPCQKIFERTLILFRGFLLWPLIFSK